LHAKFFGLTPLGGDCSLEALDLVGDARAGLARFLFERTLDLLAVGVVDSDE
jgi:hypothetical protein